MVREAGRENGCGIWELDGYEQIHTRIVDRISEVDSDFEFDEIVIIGSFGTGLAVPGESDLDVLVFGIFNAPISQSELSVWQSELAEKIMSVNIIEDFDAIESLDLYIEDPAHKEQAINQYWAYEPVEYYYNLTADEKRTYKSNI